MPKQGKATKEAESRGLMLSRKADVVETQHSGFTPYSESLSGEISQSQNFLKNHAQRLENLIHSEVELLENEYVNSAPEDRVRKLSHEQMQSVTTMGHQLLETIKLGVSVAGVRMQIERGFRNE